MLQPRLNCEGNCNRMPFRSFVLLVALLLGTTLVTCQDIKNDEQIESSRIKREGVPENRAFNTNGIVYDNTPWRPGRDMDLVEKESEEDERRLKNLATRIMSNGVEVLVKDKNPDGKQEQTKYMEVKTIQPSAATNMFMSNYPMIDKRIDSGEDESNSFDLIQPSEVSNPPCTSSCSCSDTKTEGLKTKYSNMDYSGSSTKYGIKTTYGATKLELRPTNKESMDKKTHYGPYEYESNSQLAPTDKVVEKYTEVINDYSDEKDSNSVEESELLTNEQAPAPQKTNKESTKVPEKAKPEKPQKPNKNKFVVADLLKLGTLGIKGLTQLAPVIEKMTGGFIKRQDTVNKTTTTTIKPAVKLTAYNANKRVDNDLEVKHSNFPIYIPVDELETSESQLVFTNATLHQNLAWAAEHKQPKAHIVPPKMVHESPLVNGGIPISPGEIITANSDVIVGKPAVGGPLTLAASGIKLQNSVNPPPIDSFIAANEQYFVNEKPLGDQPHSDDSYDLRPPEPPQQKSKPNRPMPRPMQSFNLQNSAPNDKYPYRMPASIHDHLMKTEQIKNTGPVLGNHGRPAFLDYIPSLARPTNAPTQQHIENTPVNEASADTVPDNSPSSSEIVNTQIRTEHGYKIAGNTESSKPFLVDIQPSRVANVLIPHGSSTALVFAGSSEPHKTGDYIDDPLPYPEPGYFGSFSIDAPQMTNVHNVAPNSNKPYAGKPNAHPPSDNYKPNQSPYKDQSHRSDLKIKWKDNKRPIDYNKIPPPTSNQETHVQVGPQITVYDPEVYNPTGANGNFDKYNHVRNKDKQKDGKEVIDKEYENYLAVPPPPQTAQKQIFNQDGIYDKSKPYSSRPIVHTKPVQDMKVFLNIQHPVPEQLPPKVTSEIYFAAQMPNSNPTPTYTIRMPPASPNYNNFNQSPNNIQPSKGNNAGSTHNSFSVISSPNMANKSFVPQVNEDKDNTYTVTLNTATNVASNNEAGQVIGSSVAVPVGTSTHVSQLNTDIPIGTNFAIRVEDNATPLETYNLQGTRNPPIVFNEKGLVTQVSVGDNRWNKSSTDIAESTITGNTYHNQNSNYGDKKPNYKDTNQKYGNHNQNQRNKNQNYGNNQNQNQGTINQHYANQNQNHGILNQNYANENQNQGTINQDNANKKENQDKINQNKDQSQENINQHFANIKQNQGNINQNYANQNKKNQGILNQNQGILHQNQGILNQNQGILNQNQGIINQNYENKKQNQGNANQNYANNNKNFENQNHGNINQNQNQGHTNTYFPKKNQNQGHINPIYDNKQQNYNNQYHNYGDKNARDPVSPAIPPSLNSHANFPMMNDYSTSSTDSENVKPITEYPDNIKSGDVKRPAKLIPNIPTNSHGWYSTLLKESNINNIKVEATTRKIIPLIHDYNEKNNSPSFGQKITSAGKPPNEFWSQNAPPSGFTIGKPFAKPQSTDKPFSTSPPFTTKPFNINYIPSNFGGMAQPAYDIPIRDNSDETTTTKSKHTTEKIKPVYENSEEIYDGEDEPENHGEIDGEVSSESMKVPVVSSSSEIDNNSKTSTELTLLQDEVLNPPKNVQKDENSNQVLVNFNPGTQTEKPFSSYNKTTFQSNTIKPIYENNPQNKPRPFTINTSVLDHQLQQPHWQINHMMENATNVSYEDNIDLNIGEEMDKPSTYRPSSSSRPVYVTESDVRYKRPPIRPVFANRFNNTHVHNESIITSTVHIQNKKPFIVQKTTEKSTLPTFTLSNLELNHSSSEIIDLSPPPPTMDYNFKPSTNVETIMGMSPPPPRTPPGIRIPTRVPLTPRPALPIRTPPPYRTRPPRVTTQRPVRKPINRDEVSTYRPAYDILNNMKRPTYNRDQPSSQLLPPPTDIPSRVVKPVELPAPTVSVPEVPNVVFPTPISSGWLTSSGIDFSSSFSFNPTSIQFPETPEPSRIPDYTEVSSSENSYSYEAESSSERVDEVNYEKPVTEDKEVTSKESSTQSTTTTKVTSITETNVSEPVSSQEETTTDKMKIIPLGNKNRTRKPYPVRIDEKKTTTSKYKLPPKPTSIIKPTRTLPRPEILYPTRQTSIKKIIGPSIRVPPIIPSSIIESSESSVDEDFIRPTEVLKEKIVPTVSELEITRPVEQETSSIPIIIPPSLATPSIEEVPVVQPIHHAGNEVKISDDVVPTKTEFRTTVVTLTKTLSEPPKTVSSIGFVNITHTLTVTHTKTSLISQSEGAVTQTLVLTNTQTSTIVDVVTEVHTQVQPTTIIETVTKHIPIPQLQPTPVQEIIPKTKVSLDDVTMSSEENDNLIIKETGTTDNIIQKIENENEPENDNDTFFVVMNKSQNGRPVPPLNNDVDTGDYDVTRNEQVNNNGVSQVLFGEILLAGTPYLETTNVNPNGVAYGKECQPDCKASRNERCQRIDGLMKCVCRPGFARMFPDRPCKPTYTYSVKLALGSQGNEHLEFHEHLSDNSSKEYHELAVATHEGINRMIMQSDLRDVYHGVHITGFHPVELKSPGGDLYQGVMNDFYVQLSDNAHESRLKEVIEKYLRNNNYSLGGTEVHAASELMEKLNVSDFDECVSGSFHDCSEHAQCFNLRGTYTCSCLEGFADLSVNALYPGRICSAEPVGCERCNYHGACYSRDDRRVLCECFQWYAGSSCQINLKVVLISLVVCGALLTVVLAVCAVLACSRRARRAPRPQRSIVACIQSMPSLHQGAMPKQRQDRRALISERGESGDNSSVQNASLPYIPAKRVSSSGKKCVMSDPPAHDPPPPPAPAVMIPRARLHPHHGDSRENIARKRSLELSNEAKLISYLESGATSTNNEMRRKHSLGSSYSANQDRHNKQGALVSAGFKVSTTIRADESGMKDDRDDMSSVTKGDLEAELARFDTLRKSYSQEDLSEWTDAERRLGELTLSEARSVGGTLPASTGRAASSTRLTHQEHTMAERDLGSTFLLPHVHLYKPDLTSDVSEFDSL